MHRSCLCLLLVALTLTLLFGCTQQQAYQPPPPPKVTVTKPIVKTVPVYLEENGETEAVEQAIVRSRVRGILEKILFEPDSVVEKDDPLFSIERKEYEAAVTAAKAAVSSAEAALTSALAAVEVAVAQIAASDASIKVSKAELDRMNNLAKAVSQSELDAAQADYDTALAAKQGSNAAKAAAEAEVDNARAAKEKADAELIRAELDLNWTTVTAPIKGRVARTLVKEGNLVENGAELVEIVQRDPIWANFNISERFLLNIEEHTKDNRSIAEQKIKVYLKRSGDPDFIFEGYLDFADPRVDQKMGSMQLRAVFPNNQPGKILLPGLFVRVRIEVGRIEDALLVPERAIGRDQIGTFVYVVDKEKNATRINVELGVKHEGMIVIIPGTGDGEQISPDDSIIVDGVQRVRPGTPVDPS